LPPHGIATSQFFRWRVQVDLTARKTPQLATVMLADSAMSQVRTLNTLRDPGRAPDGMAAITMEIARSRRDGATSSPCAAALYRKAGACDGAQFGHSAAASRVAHTLDVGSNPEA
jgi:transposase-like protein